jgi:hypothetical protein
MLGGRMCFFVNKKDERLILFYAGDKINSGQSIPVPAITSG